MKVARLERVVGSLLFVTLLADPAFAQFRQYVPIPSPREDVSALPRGTKAVAKFAPVSRRVVEREVGKILEQWNTPQMADTLAEDFFDRTRLLDLVNNDLPRDARVRMLSLQTVRTLQQYEVPAEGGEPASQVSIVSAVAQTQIQFNSPTGFVQLPGTNEFILRVTQPAARK